MPTGYRWFRGGPGLSRAGRNALFAADDTTVWVWDEETGNPVTDLLDETATPISAPKVVDGWVLGAGLPNAVRVASFSLGKDGKRYPLEPANAAVLAQASADAATSSAADASSSASSAAASAALVGAPAGTAIDAHINGGTSPAVRKGDLVYRVNDYATPQACLDAAPAGATVLFQGTYAVPAGGFILKASGLTIEAMGATFNVSNWGTPVFLGLRSNSAGDDHTFRIGLVQYTGTRGDHTGTLRGSALYCSGNAVQVNGDRNYVERVRTIGMPVPVFFSSWDGTSSTDRTGTGNRIGYLEASGYDFGLLYVKQTGFDWGNAYCHDDTDDSSGTNPTHAIYCSGSNGNRAGIGKVGQWAVKNHTHGHPFIFKYQDQLTCGELTADSSYGVLNVLDSDDFSAGRVVATNSIATAGQGAVTFGFTTAAPQRPTIGQILVTQSAGVNERAVSLWADDADINLVKVVSNRTTTDANNGELVVRGNRNNVAKLRTRAIGTGTQLAALLGANTDGAIDCCIADVEAFGSANDALPVATFAASLGARWARRSEDSVHGGAAPTTGTWKRGAFVRNYAPNAGATYGWVCVTAGTPGTWKVVSTIST
jgi:hypothetical protein